MSDNTHSLLMFRVCVRARACIMCERERETEFKSVPEPKLEHPVVKKFVHKRTYLLSCSIMNLQEAAAAVVIAILCQVMSCSTLVVRGIAFSSQANQ